MDIDRFWYWEDVDTILGEHRELFIQLISSLAKNGKDETGRKLGPAIIYEQVIQFHDAFNDVENRPQGAQKLKIIGTESRPEGYATQFNEDRNAIKRRGKAEAYGYLAWLWEYQPEKAKQFYDKIGLLMPEEAQKTLSRELRESFTEQRPKPNIVLSPARRSSELYHYSRRNIAVLGREDEKKKLSRFMSEQPGFQWLQLAGVAGQGKSRLAWDLIQDYSDRWDAGFLRRDNLLKALDTLDDWRPLRNTLIVVDYVNGVTKEASRFLSTLMANSHVYDRPVRVLLLERHRWDAGLKILSGAHRPDRSESYHLSQTDTFAPWFAELCNTLDGNDLNDREFRFEDGIIELTALSEKNLVKIVRDTAASMEHKIEDDDAYIESALRYIDRAGRPLFAYFLATCIADGSYQAGWSRTDLLRAIIRKDRRTRWQPPDNPDRAEAASYQKGVWLAVLATLTGGIDNRSLKVNRSIVEWACRITDTPRDEFSEPIHVDGLEPDILGEWFVLSFSPLGEKLEQLLNLAWFASPGAVVEFLIRLVQDFPEDGRVLPFVEFAPEDSAARQAYDASASLLSSHVGVNCGNPLAPSGRCITNQGSTSATPDTPMTISWRRLHRDQGRELSRCPCPRPIPSTMGLSPPVGCPPACRRWTRCRHTRPWMADDGVSACHPLSMSRGGACGK